MPLSHKKAWIPLYHQKCSQCSHFSNGLTNFFFNSWCVWFVIQIRSTYSVWLMFFKSLLIHSFLLSTFPFLFLFLPFICWKKLVICLVKFPTFWILLIVSLWCLWTCSSVLLFLINRWLGPGAWAELDLISWQKGWSFLGRGMKWPRASVVALGKKTLHQPPQAVSWICRWETKRSHPKLP